MNVFGHKPSNEKIEEDNKLIKNLQLSNNVDMTVSNPSNTII